MPLLEMVAAGTAYTHGWNGADVLDDGVASYTPGLGEHRVNANNAYVPDRMGSYQLVTNTVGTTALANRDWDSFGNRIYLGGTTASPFGYAGAWGYQEDGDSGLKLLGHRFYDSSTGRFLSRDPTYDGRNWYAYAVNSPNQFVDPLGLETIIVRGETAGGDADISYWADVIAGRFMSSEDGPTSVVDTVEEAASLAHEGDTLIFVGHSDGDHLYMHESGVLDPGVFAKTKLKKVILVGCNTLSNPQQAARWSRVCS